MISGVLGALASEMFIAGMIFDASMAFGFNACLVGDLTHKAIKKKKEELKQKSEQK